MARIITVYAGWRTRIRLLEMAFIRWVKISEALARRGHEVDIATNEAAVFRWWDRRNVLLRQRNVGTVPLRKVRWADYDVVKTLFHAGFETLKEFDGVSHPFIISKLGSVVGSRELDGVYFYGDNRRRLYQLQQEISESARYVALLTEPARSLWWESHGCRENILLVPGGVDADIPLPQRDPFRGIGRPRCIFAGNIYDRKSQPEANAVLVAKLNELGRRLIQLGIHLCFLGVGDTTRLDKRCVNHLGYVPYEKTWDYLHFADVGAVVAAGAFMHNNESTKIYHYLRAGLPTVTESGFPNENVITEAGLGFVVENANLGLMAAKIREAAETTWDKKRSVDYILKNHTWDRRVQVYDDLISSQLESGPRRSPGECG